jgi:hypothetical protein
MRPNHTNRKSSLAHPKCFWTTNEIIFHVCKHLLSQASFALSGQPGGPAVAEQVPAVAVRDRGDGEGHPADVRRLQVQGSILHSSISAENFSDKFCASNFGHSSTQKQHIQMYLIIMNNNRGF